MAELRAVVMRPDLQRLGRFDEVRVRRRFLEGFTPDHTQVVVVRDRAVGLVALRPEPGAWWLEHFYLEPTLHRQGMGSQVLAHVLRLGAGPRPIRLNVLAGSPARRLYERHGFVEVDADSVDVWMERPVVLP